MRRSHACKRARIQRQCVRVGSLQEPSKKTKMTPNAESENTNAQCRPRWKEGKNVDRIDKIDSNKNTPDLRTLVTTHQSWSKNNIPESKNLAHSSDRRGLQTVKEDEILCSLIRTAHEIHYRWNQWRMNWNRLRWKCSCSSRCEKLQQNDRNNSKRLGSRIDLHLKFPTYYPPGRHHYNAFAIYNWKDTRIKLERSTCWSPRMWPIVLSIHSFINIPITSLSPHSPEILLETLLSLELSEEQYLGSLKT